MAKLLKLRRGTTSQHGSFTGAEGEVTVDTDKETLIVHDGSTAGGHPVAAEDMANVSSSAIAGRLSNDSLAVGKIAAGTLPSDVKIADANVSGNLTIESADIVDGTIVNADVNASAAIAGTKISPDFGSQNVVTTGTLGTGDHVTLSGTNPRVTFADSNHNPDFEIYGSAGNFKIWDSTNSTGRLIVNTDGHIDIPGNLDVGAGIDVTGNMTVTGTVDGRDVAADGTKLDGIESSATADQTAAEIRTLVESASDSNVFTDADHSKLNGIEASATADQSNAEIRAAVEAASDSNVFTDADHSKLNGIEASATADQSNAEIRAAVEAASDSNVFTDADHTKLNGIETSATADQTAGEIASALNGQNIAPASMYTGTGSFGGDNQDCFQFTADTRLDLYINNSNEFRFEADGDFHADGDVYAFSTTVSSDENLKKDITIVSDAVTKVEALKGVTFKWKKNDADSAGVIAQDVEKVLPQIVKTVADIDGNNYKAVNYGGLTSILIEAIKDLSARVKVLEAK